MNIQLISDRPCDDNPPIGGGSTLHCWSIWRRRWSCATGLWLDGEWSCADVQQMPPDPPPSGLGVITYIPELDTGSPPNKILTYQWLQDEGTVPNNGLCGACGSYVLRVSPPDPTLEQLDSDCGASPDPPAFGPSVPMLRGDCHFFWFNPPSGYDPPYDGNYEQVPFNFDDNVDFSEIVWWAVKLKNGDMAYLTYEQGPFEPVLDGKLITKVTIYNNGITTVYEADPDAYLVRKNGVTWVWDGSDDIHVLLGMLTVKISPDFIAAGSRCLDGHPAEVFFTLTTAPTGVWGNTIDKIGGAFYYCLKAAYLNGSGSFNTTSLPGYDGISFVCNSVGKSRSDFVGSSPTSGMWESYNYDTILGIVTKVDELWSITGSMTINWDPVPMGSEDCCDCVNGVWTLSNILLNGAGPTTIPETSCGNSLKFFTGSTGYLCIDSNTNPYYNSLLGLQYLMAGMSDGCGNYVSTYLQSLPADHNPPYANLYDELFAVGNVLDRFLAWVYVRSPSAYLESYGTPADCDYRGPTFGCAWWLCVKKLDNSYVHAGGLIGWAYMHMQLHNSTKQPNGTCKWDLDFVCSGSPGAGGWWFLSQTDNVPPITLDCCPGNGDTTTISLDAVLGNSGSLTATMTFAAV